MHIPGARSLALWSYSIYLSHKAVAQIVQTELAALALPSAWMPALITLASLAVGWLLYRCIEVPCMALRERHVPALFAPKPGGGAALPVAARGG